MVHIIFIACKSILYSVNSQRIKTIFEIIIIIFLKLPAFCITFAVMEKNMFIGLFVIFMSANAQAQTEEPLYKKYYGEQEKSILETARSGMDVAAGKITEMLAPDESTADMVKVKGTYYMYLYDVNLYNGKRAKMFMDECRQQFVSRYPKARIMSVACPQQGWLQEPIMRNKQTVGYTQTMYVYIVAQDGHDGYINARFSYKCYKNVDDKAYAPLVDNWPRWDRTDHLTPSVYEKVKSKR